LSYGRSKLMGASSPLCPSGNAPVQLQSCPTRYAPGGGVVAHHFDGDPDDLKPVFARCNRPAKPSIEAGLQAHSWIGKDCPLLVSRIPYPVSRRHPKKIRFQFAANTVPGGGWLRKKVLIPFKMAVARRR